MYRLAGARGGRRGSRRSRLRVMTNSLVLATTRRRKRVRKARVKMRKKVKRAARLRDLRGLLGEVEGAVLRGVEGEDGAGEGSDGTQAVNSNRECAHRLLLPLNIRV